MNLAEDNWYNFKDGQIISTLWNADMINNLQKLILTAQNFLKWKYPTKDLMPETAKIETGYDAKKEKYFVKIDGNTIEVYHNRPQNVVDMALARLVDHMKILHKGLGIDCQSLHRKNLLIGLQHSDLDKIINNVSS